MGQKFAAYNSQGAIVAYYDSDDSPPPASATTIEITDSEWLICLATPGYTVVDNAIVAPPAPTAAQIEAQALVQSAQAALVAGLQVSSTGTPALNGTYAIDQFSQMDIIAIETGLNAGKGFPAGTTTLNYPDTTGLLHNFSEANFTDFAAVVRDYVYALKSVMAGQSSSLPSAAVTIA
ncbi:hypothetical protein LMG24238_06886 [Paraburkholderia sediminicola]|uniref:DUF4376 domain-containing protein n=1 Tax=Paraburkholderia sediminicola TaxID=458836 RepID=A0A6J5CNR4_9BURK|nr:hypothetical protein [Paraburkholderia sediminicola]CAB3742462.1 hypothetical protein LMG24238_06886 [Paraburkholderia sediminicola]